MSGRVWLCLAAMSSAPMTVTLLATSDSGVGIRVALTTTRSVLPSSREPESAAARPATGQAAAVVRARVTASAGNLDTRNSVATHATCRHDGFSRSHQHTPAGNRTTARGGCPGSRVIACILLPKALAASVDSSDAHSPVTVAGAAAVLHRVPIKSL